MMYFGPRLSKPHTSKTLLTVCLLACLDQLVANKCIPMIKVLAQLRATVKEALGMKEIEAKDNSKKAGMQLLVFL